MANKLNQMLLTMEIFLGVGLGITLREKPTLPPTTFSSPFPSRSFHETMGVITLVETD